MTEKLADLKRQLAPQDQAKVEQYTEAVRDVERRIQMVETQTEVELPSLAQPRASHLLSRASLSSDMRRRSIARREPTERT